MAENDKPKFDLPWATLLPLAAVLAGIIAQYKPLVSSRPAVPSEKSVPVIAEQDVDARLWQDPIAVAQKQRSSLIADILAGRIPRSSAKNHDIGTLVKLLNERVGEVHKHVLLLAVMLDAGPYSEQGELRLRAREAVLEGLNASGFVPRDGEHIGYVTTPWPDVNAAESVQSNSLLLPWEECEAMDDPKRASPPGTESVFVLWLPAVDLNPFPLRRFAALIDILAPNDIRDRIDVKLIGPPDSTGLQNMIREVRGELRPDTKKALDRVCIISPLATASDDTLLYQPSQPSGESDVPGCSQKNSVKDLLEKSCSGLHFWRTIATDDVVLPDLIKELELRQISFPGKEDASVSKRDRVVILSEWDTPYGRSLSTTFAAAASHQSVTEIIDKPENWPSWILHYRYLRGIDGQLPGEAGKDNSREQPQKNQLGQETVAVEATEGLNQSDYLRRLARQLKEKNAVLQKQGGAGIRAIGLLGSDLYDKLMILRALRPEFPEALFFTINYDAHFERRDDWGDAHNLIIASPFGNRLPSRPKDRGKHVERVAPFRDNNQTSMYGGTLVATGKWDAADLSQQHHVFEISRRGAFDLSTTFKKTWFLDWLQSDYVKLKLLFAALFLALMVAWVSANIANRALSGGGTTVQRLRRVVSSTAFWLVCGTPVIIFSVAAFAQSKWAGQEPLAFFSGISIWPSEMLRLIAFMLGIHFMIKAGIDLRANERELEERFCLNPLPPTRFRWRDIGIGLDLWRTTHPNELEAEPEFSAQEAWHAYLRRNKFWPRFIRVGILVTMYFGFSFAIFQLLPQLHSPTRGEVAFWFNLVVIYLTAIGMMILSFYVVDAIQLNSNFIRMFAREVTRWGRGVVERSHRSPPLSEEELSAYNEIFFVAQRTEVVARLIWYPLIILTLMLVARSSFFANWTWPFSLILISGLNATWALGSAILLRRAAEQLRLAAIRNLQLSRVWSHAVAEKREMFDELIAEIRALKKGAFAPLTQQPFIHAILFNSGGLGLLAVGQRLLEIY
jgi:hypothetical protein